MGDAELEIARPDGATARVPVVSIIRLDVKKRGEIVVVGLSSPIDVSDLRSQQKGANASRLHEFVLVFLPNEARVALATLHSWLPQLTEQMGGSLNGLQPSTAEVSALNLDGITLTGHDIRLLGDKRCLNDTCLDFFMRLLFKMAAFRHLRDNIWIASTFFFQKLTSGGANSGEDGWESVSRWTPKFRAGGVLSRQYLFLPINVEKKHWWLAVICNPSSAFFNKANRSGDVTPRIVF